MKYNENNKPLVCMMTQSTCYKGTSTMTPKGILWHSTGANNSTIKRYVQPDDNAKDRDELLKIIGKNKNGNDWNHISKQAGLNCWIGKLADGTVATVQTMPWNYKPWGCGSGSKGSLNNGWIQFEICEDGLTDKGYFDKVYAEACEITAYLCEMYNIDPKGTVTVNGVQVPTILCHADSHKLGFGSNHGDVNHWFPKFNKSMETARNDVANLLKKDVVSAPAAAATKVIYRVRKSWKDAASQIGAFSNLNNAKETCDKAGEDYFVFDENGKAIYPVKIEEVKPSTPASNPYPTLRKGDKREEVKTLQKKLNDFGYTCGSVDGSFGAKTQSAVLLFQSDLDLEKDGVCGPKTWAAINSFKPVKGVVTASKLNVRSGPGTKYKVKTTLKKGSKVTIVKQKDGWGKLQFNGTWVSMQYVQK